MADQRRPLVPWFGQQPEVRVDGGLHPCLQRGDGAVHVRQPGNRGGDIADIRLVRVMQQRVEAEAPTGFAGGGRPQQIERRFHDSHGMRGDGANFGRVAEEAGDA